MKKDYISQESKILNLRPHHLLCLKWFVGEGYSSEFTKNMSKIHETLIKNNAPFTLSLKSDDICLKCPNMNSYNICTSYAKVYSMDSKVLKYLSLSEGKPYYYSDTSKKIDELFTDKIINDICGDCQWFSLNLCWGMVK